MGSQGYIAIFKMVASIFQLFQIFKNIYKLLDYYLESQTQRVFTLYWTFLHVIAQMKIIMVSEEYLYYKRTQSISNKPLAWILFTYFLHTSW